MRELALHARRDEIPGPSLRGPLQCVLAATGAREGLADLVLGGEDYRRPEMHLREEKGVGRRVLRGDPLEPRGVGPAGEVIRKVKQIHGDARLEERIADLRQDLVELRPGEVKGFEVLQAARTQDTPLQGLPPAG